MSNKLTKNKSTSPKTKEGIEFYNQIGHIFILCGFASFLILVFVMLLPQDYGKYNISLFFGIWAVISLILVTVGALPLLLGKYCKKYQIWIEKEVKSYQDQMLNRAEKRMQGDMKKYLTKILLFTGYCIPFAFLSMYGDITHGTMLLYICMIAGFGILSFSTVWTKHYSFVIWGNLISFVSSYACLQLFSTEKWEWYFKPLTAHTLMSVISIAAFLVQIGIVSYTCRRDT